MCQWSSITCKPSPGIINLPSLPDIPDLPDFRKTREKSSYSTKLPSSFHSDYNSITDFGKPTTSPVTANIHPIQLTHEDAVVTGANSVYGSQSQLSNGGMIFAIRQGEGSTSSPLMSAGNFRNYFSKNTNADDNHWIPAPPQPVLMQYLSPQGVPQQAAVQYIQLLRPIMMVPAQPYQPPRPMPEIHAPSTVPPTPKPTQEPPVRSSTEFHHPYGPYSRHALSHSSHMPSYMRPQHKPSSFFDLGFNLNLNEFLPSASSIAAVLAPRSSMGAQFLPYPAYKPAKYSQYAQRA